MLFLRKYDDEGCINKQRVKFDRRMGLIVLWMLAIAILIAVVVAIADLWNNMNNVNNVF